jgi:hypothetical protein
MRAKTAAAREKLGQIAAMGTGELLGVAEGAAGCRIQVARVCQKFPEILVALADEQIRIDRLAEVLGVGDATAHLEEILEKAVGDALTM